MLYPSAYNVVVPNGNEVLLFNTHTLYFGRLDTSLYREAEELVAALRDNPGRKLPDSQAKQVAFELRQGGFFVEDREAEVVSVISRFDNQKQTRQHFGLTIAPTDGCNFACPYCYEHLNYASMTEETQRHVADYIERSLAEGGFTSMHVTWYGGEPLIPQSLNAIEYLTGRIVAACDKYKVSYSANMISNGYLLSRQVAERLAAWKIALVQITLDGPVDQHNKTRVLKTGVGTFERIVENIKANTDLLRFSIRMNVTRENAGSVADLKNFLREAGILNDAGRTSFYVSPVRSYTSTCRTSECMSNAEFYRLQLELLKNGINDDGCYVVEDFPVSKQSVCTAVGEDSFVIGPSGDLYKCWLDLGRKELSVGNIGADAHELNAQMSKWMGFSPFEESGCGTCTVLPLCMGGCPELNMRSIGENENQACCNWKYFLKEHLLHLSKKSSEVALNESSSGR